MIAILLSTYNGEKFLRQQLDSIINQDYRDWTLYIRDDGSSDNTLKILHEYYELYDKIIIIKDNLGNLGVAQSFFCLMNCVDANYYMFCDQDDIWLQNKISISLNCMHELESSYGTKLPLLVFTDLQIVDADLNVLNKSFFENCGTTSIVSTQKFHYTGSMVPGCVMLFNKSAKDVSAPYKKSKYVIHDYWLILKTISNHGYIKCLNLPTMLYRQHGHNTLGAKYDRGSFCSRLARINKVLIKDIGLFREIRFITNLNFISFLKLKLKTVFLFNRK